jgi:hypothetical protein
VGFSPSLIGLPGPITGRFLDPRPDGCPHKGLDIGSAGISKTYTAGIYGKVVPPNPNDSKWCTIAVQPFHDAQATIQYLHSSSSRVGVGDIVAPWTEIGDTGNCSPTPVPIHLHIQVAFNRTPSYPCWGTRDFVDPETWNLGAPLLGTWVNSEAQPDGTVQTRTLYINNDLVSGLMGNLETLAQIPVVRNGRRCDIELLIKEDLMCTSLSQKNFKNVITQNTTYTVPVNPCSLPVNVNLPPLSGQITLDSATNLSWRTSGSVITYTKKVMVEIGAEELARAPESSPLLVTRNHLGSIVV